MVTSFDMLALRTADAIALRWTMHAMAGSADNQTIDGRVDPVVGWVVSGDLQPVPMHKIAGACRLSDEGATSAMDELLGAGIAVRSDQGAWGLGGWVTEQPEARRRGAERGGTTAIHPSNAFAKTPDADLRTANGVDPRSNGPRVSLSPTPPLPSLFSD